MKQSEFYDQCAELLNTKSLYEEQPEMVTKYSRETGEPYKPMTRATRWGGREPGNGRFPGHGLIRVFSPSVIHVNLTHPKFSGQFTSFESVLEALAKVCSIEKEKEIGVGDSIQVIFNDEDYGMCEIVANNEEFDCWMVLIEKTYSNGYKELLERYYPKNKPLTKQRNVLK